MKFQSLFERQVLNMANIKDYFESHIKCKVCTLVLNGDWTTPDKINIIKQVNKLEKNFVIKPEYDKKLNTTRVFYCVER